MKQVEKLIENLEGKFKIKVESFLDLYERNASSELLQESLGITENTVRVITRTLNIRMPKKHRSNDLALLKSRFGDSAVSLDLQETKGDLEASYRDNLKLEKKLVEMRRELQKFKLVHKNPEIDFEEIRNAVLGAIRPVKPVEVKVLQNSKKFAGHVQWILLSDLHFEATVTRDDVGDSNEYSWEIAKSRLAKVFAESINSYRGEDKCIVMMAGDIFDGLIHDSLETAGKPLGKAIAELAVIMKEHLDILAGIYNEVEILCVSGNHERQADRKKSHAQGYGYAYLFYELIQAMMAAQSNTKVIISTSGYITTTIGTTPIGMMHGDYVLGPTNDIKVLKVKELFRQTLGVIPQHIFSGHTHIPEVKLSGNSSHWICNGSLIGTNAYSHTNGFVGVDWAQAIGSFTPEGKVEFVKWVSE